MLEIARELGEAAGRLRFRAPVTRVYNPLEYAWAPHAMYLERYGRGPCEVLLVGMNPGPFGMVQTGVPFGDVVMVRDWMGIEAPVGKPRREHPKRPVQGFACPRREVSGQRLWGWARDRFGSPARFFARFFVHNYCPLCFMEESGRNRTPDKLAVAERERLFAICDRSLGAVLGCLAPRYVLGVGRFASERAHAALAGTDATIGMVPHPSPANPAANRGWGALMDGALAALGVRIG